MDLLGVNAEKVGEKREELDGEEDDPEVAGGDAQVVLEDEHEADEEAETEVVEEVGKGVDRSACVEAFYECEQVEAKFLGLVSDLISGEGDQNDDDEGVNEGEDEGRSNESG